MEAKSGGKQRILELRKESFDGVIPVSLSGLKEMRGDECIWRVKIEMSIAIMDEKCWRPEVPSPSSKGWELSNSEGSQQEKYIEDPPMSNVGGMRVETLLLGTIMGVQHYCKGVSRAEMHGGSGILGREGRRSRRRGMRRTG